MICPLESRSMLRRPRYCIPTQYIVKFLYYIYVMSAYMSVWGKMLHAATCVRTKVGDLLQKWKKRNCYPQRLIVTAAGRKARVRLQPWRSCAFVWCCTFVPKKTWIGDIWYSQERWTNCWRQFTWWVSFSRRNIRVRKLRTERTWRSMSACSSHRKTVPAPPGSPRLPGGPGVAAASSSGLVGVAASASPKALTSSSVTATRGPAVTRALVTYGSGPNGGSQAALGTALNQPPQGTFLPPAVVATTPVAVVVNNWQKAVRKWGNTFLFHAILVTLLCWSARKYALAPQVKVAVSYAHTQISFTIYVVIHNLSMQPLRMLTQHGVARSHPCCIGSEQQNMKWLDAIFWDTMEMDGRITVYDHFGRLKIYS